MSVARLRLAPVGETMFPPRAPFFCSVGELPSSPTPPKGSWEKGHPMTLWGGRVGRPLDPAVSEFLRADDAELLPYDCEATAVHARRLHAAGLLDDAELAEAEAKLAEIAGGSEPPGPEDEDVHSAIERLLGEGGRKIHAGRSRNDQVA